MMGSHGVGIHVGMCRAKAQRLEAESRRLIRETEEQAADAKRRRTLTQEEEDDEDLFGIHPEAAPLEAVAAAPAAAAALPVEALNSTDRAWLQVFYDRKDLSSSLLDDILPLTRMPEETQFVSVAGLLGFIDDLPGPVFEDSTLELPNCAAPFVFAARPIVPLMKEMIDRHNGEFTDPEEDPTLHFEHPDFVDGTRFRRLLSELHEAAGSDSVLMPLILSSGMLHVCITHGAFYACAYVDHCTFQTRRA